MATHTLLLSRFMLLRRQAVCLLATLATIATTCVPVHAVQVFGRLYAYPFLSVRTTVVMYDNNHTTFWTAGHVGIINVGNNRFIEAGPSQQLVVYDYGIYPY